MMLRVISNVRYNVIVRCIIYFDDYQELRDIYIEHFNKEIPNVFRVLIL